jgi:hypothetical protein
MTDPTELYQYRVMVTQDESVLDGIYAWSKLTAQPEVDYNSDVIASSDFIDNSASAVDSLEGGTSAEQLTGKYDPMDEGQSTGAESVPEGYNGIVVGMLTNQYRDSISNEFTIYSDTESSSASAGSRAASSTLNFKYVQDDLTQDAGIIWKEPKKKENKKTPNNPKSKHKHRGLTNLLNPELLLPPTGGSMAALGVLILAVIGGVGFVLTGKKKKKKKEDGEDQKGDSGHEKEEDEE